MSHPAPDTESLAAMPRLPITRRIDLNLGYSCNQRCRFCYYQQSIRARRKDRDLSTCQAKARIERFRRWGMEVLEFTGGEPTVRSDLPELAGFALSSGFRAVSVITNGLRMAERGYAASLADAGISDVLVSVHSSDAAVHDGLSGVPGSHERTMSAIRNCLEQKFKVRTNTVVTGRNLDQIHALVGILRGMGVRTVNLILFNPIVEADCTDSDTWIEYSKAAPVLESIFREYDAVIPKLTARYIPFCLLPGRESRVTNIAQIQYDPDEWNYYFRTLDREGFLPWSGALFVGCALSGTVGRTVQAGWFAAKHEALKKALEVKNKVHGPPCRRCSMRLICDGLWRPYAKRRGFDELIPYDGEVLRDPDIFMRGRSL
ncbi:MAG TPA: radical SAM protein [Candidatus Brocadiia bacterium]|nr:radical SAM protein [Candidatus Brocadiia bacterium]